MPTYAYACKNCGHEFDIVQSFSDASLTECPQCKGQLRKKFNSVGVVFKGSGFYRTDSRGASGSSTVPAGGNGSAPASAPSASAASSAASGSATSASGSSGGSSAASGSAAS